MTKQRLQLKTAAEMYDIPYMALWQAVRADQIPGEQLGRRWYVRPADIEAYFERTSTPNEAEKARRAERTAP